MWSQSTRNPRDLVSGSHKIPKQTGWLSLQPTMPILAKHRSKQYLTNIDYGSFTYSLYLFIQVEVVVDPESMPTGINTGNNVGIHPEWDASPLQDTMNTHIPKLIQGWREHMEETYLSQQSSSERQCTPWTDNVFLCCQYSQVSWLG